MEAPPETVQTLCRMCDDRCGIDVRLEDGRVVDITGNPAHPWSSGRLCVKARAAVDTVNHPDRLLRPLKRRGEDWEEIPLEQALDEIAERLRAIIARDGARSVSVWKGEAIGFAQQEDLARRFIHAIGSPNYLSNDSMCWVGRFTGYKLVLGAWPNVDIENARCVVMWGANPPHSRPNLTQRITRARRRGATLVAVDPRLSAVARRADLHVAPLPGTDGALALGLVRELVESGSCDRSFVERATVGFDELAAYARDFTPRSWSERPGSRRRRSPSWRGCSPPPTGAWRSTLGTGSSTTRTAWTTSAPSSRSTHCSAPWARRAAPSSPRRSRSGT